MGQAWDFIGTLKPVWFASTEAAVRALFHWDCRKSNFMGGQALMLRDLCLFCDQGRF